jgi:ferredoxin/coenzyme F420-reducing hydrogenase delta subunit
MNLVTAIKNSGVRCNRAIEHTLDTAFDTEANPWRNLGPLGFMFLWIVVVSGLYLYAAFDTSVAGALQSIDYLSQEQKYIGGIMRSLHRYAADAFVLVTLLHVLREFLLGRFIGFRRFSWLTGVPLLWFIFAAGIVGFWLKWDQVAQFSALATAEWFDSLPFFATPLTRNFLSNAAINDRLFSLFVFIHIGVPLLLIFGLWFHIQRISLAKVFPPRPLAIGTLTTLLLLSLALPVTSRDSADLAFIPSSIPLDWFYLALHPLMEATSAYTLWTLTAGITLVMLLLPAWPQTATLPVAEVNPDQCNGCRRCFDDCPYAAIVMVPHPSDRPGQELAKVLPDLCASCGICAGACPSSTPFRGGEQLETGIDMPQLRLTVLRLALEQRLIENTNAIVVFGCDHGLSVADRQAPDVVSFSLLCAGMLPPSFVEYALRGGATGVLVTGCRNCAFRLGKRWTEGRLDAVREPHLRTGAERERLRLLWADRGDEKALAAALVDFRRALAALPNKTPHIPPKRMNHG